MIGWRALRHTALRNGGIGLAVESGRSGSARRDARKSNRSAEDLIGFAAATVLTVGCCLGGPRCSSGTPLAKLPHRQENQGLLLVRQRQISGQVCWCQAGASGFIEVIGDKTRFLEREAQAIQQFTQVVG